MTATSCMTLVLGSPEDLVTARARARELAQLVGFESSDQMRIACAVSEVARMLYGARGTARLDFRIVDEPAAIRIGFDGADRLRGASGTGAGASGLAAARRMVDDWSHDGDTVWLSKNFTSRMSRLRPSRLRELQEHFALPQPVSQSEWQRQNQELMAALDEMARQRDELAVLNQELEDTNRGVVALYAELDERAEHLRQAHEMKTRFLSNVSHEFRTPVNSIRALCRMLLERQDGELTEEQAHQVSLITQAADGLGDLVNDLLDMAKLEAGKLDLKVATFTCEELFGALRGMLRPLVGDAPVDLVFESCDDLPVLVTDQGKLAQILRNLLSNALKFTERGSVRVGATLDDQGGTVIFRVADTGIGIAPENIDLIFDEFKQVETPLHRRNKGTGLGLSLSRKLAGMLGGDLTVVSEPGVGSTFTLRIPVTAVTADEPVEAPVVTAPVAGRRILLVDDDVAARYVLERALPPGAEVHQAGDGEEGLALAARLRPDLVFLDLKMPRMDGFALLDALRRRPEWGSFRVVVCTSATLDAEQRRHLGAVDILAKADVSAEAVGRLLGAVPGDAA